MKDGRRILQTWNDAVWKKGIRNSLLDSASSTMNQPRMFLPNLRALSPRVFGKQLGGNILPMLKQRDRLFRFQSDICLPATSWVPRVNTYRSRTVYAHRFVFSPLRFSSFSKLANGEQRASKISSFLFFFKLRSNRVSNSRETFASR